MSKKAIITIVIAVVILVVAGGVVWYLTQEQGISSKGQADEQQSGQLQVGDNQPVLDAESEINNQPSEIDTSDWQTYRNEEYGFEVKYPGGYLVKAIKNGLYLKHPSYDLVPNSPAKGGAISIALSDQNIEDHIKEIENIDPPLSRVISKKEYTLDGEQGIEVVSNMPVGLDYYDIFITHNNKKYLISYDDIGLQYSKGILATFKFIK